MPEDSVRPSLRQALFREMQILVQTTLPPPLIVLDLIITLKFTHQRDEYKI